MSGKKKTVNKELAQEVKAIIESGAVQTEIHEQVAPLLKEQAGRIVLRGTVQNTTAVVVSPWTLTKWTAKKVIGGVIRIKTRLAKNAEHVAEVKKAKAEAAEAANAVTA